MIDNCMLYPLNLFKMRLFKKNLTMGNREKTSKKFKIMGLLFIVRHRMINKALFKNWRLNCSDMSEKTFNSKL